MWTSMMSDVMMLGKPEHYIKKKTHFPAEMEEGTGTFVNAV